MEENIRLNKASNIQVHRVGLGDRAATLPFAVNQTGNIGMSGFFDTSGRLGDYKVIELPIRRADDAFDELNLERLDLVKADVEGYELAMFEGMQRTISRFRPIIAFEDHAHLMPADGFEGFKAALPDYRFAEPTFAEEGVSRLERLAYHLREGDRMTLRNVREPEQRTYEPLLAIPKEHILAKTIVA